MTPSSKILNFGINYFSLSYETNYTYLSSPFRFPVGTVFVFGVTTINPVLQMTHGQPVPLQLQGQAIERVYIIQSSKEDPAGNKQRKTGLECLNSPCFRDCQIMHSCIWAVGGRMWWESDSQLPNPIWCHGKPQRRLQVLALVGLCICSWQLTSANPEVPFCKRTWTCYIYCIHTFLVEQGWHCCASNPIHNRMWMHLRLFIFLACDMTSIAMPTIKTTMHLFMPCSLLLTESWLFYVFFPKWGEGQYPTRLTRHCNAMCQVPCNVIDKGG